jgi:hypothetical protein
VRHLYSLLLGSALLAAAAAASTSFAGCGVDCHTTLTCGNAPLGEGGAGGASTSSTGGPGACDPSQAEGLIDDACGVFVRLSGDDADSGTKASPVATLARAIELATEEDKPVYACAEVFSEAVVVPEGTVLYGGLDCAAGWAYVGDTERTKIAPPAGEIPLKLVKGGSGTTRLVDIIAEAAPAALGSGGSSIAAIVDDITASIERCDFIAGDGADGAPGETPQTSVGPTSKEDPAIKGNPGSDACGGGAMGNPGALEKINRLCPQSIGGAGGTGFEATGGAGEDGAPLPDPNPNGYGLGGAGAAASGCMSGQSSNIGAKGGNGVGAAATALGAIDLAGYTGVDGEPGKPGAPGQGGGGGGGAKGKPGCFGASGGSGGAGGCGGGGGGGGRAGGSSMALISLGASLTFKSVKLTAGSGGSGGAGALGQSGGVGGAGGLGGLKDPTTLPGCAGGQGGPGGPGGRGGGGRGGHSIGIAFTGAAPSAATLSGATITTLMAGEGGAGDMPDGAGAEGVAMSMIAFE